MEATLSPSASANPHKPYLSFWTLAVASSGSPAPLAISAPIATFPTSTRKKSQVSFQSYHLQRRLWVAKTPNVPGFLVQMCSLVAKIAAHLPKTAHRLALRTCFNTGLGQPSGCYFPRPWIFPRKPSQIFSSDAPFSRTANPPALPGSVAASNRCPHNSVSANSLTVYSHAASTTPRRAVISFCTVGTVPPRPRG